MKMRVRRDVPPRPPSRLDRIDFVLAPFVLGCDFILFLFALPCLALVCLGLPWFALPCVRDRMDEEEPSKPSRKRARSPADEHAAAPGTISVRAPKRLRRAASAQAGAPVPGLVGTTRRAARLDKKKNRKDARRAGRGAVGGGGGGGGGAAMELDDVGGLGGTFVAG